VGIVHPMVHPGRLGWCIYPYGTPREARVVGISPIVHPGRLGGVYWCICLPTMLPRVHTGLYTTYTLPGTPYLHPVQHGQRTRRRHVAGDRALGSRRENPLGRRRREPPSLLRCAERWALCAQNLPAP